MAVHGLTRQKRDFDYLARYLMDHGYTVLAVDAPGRGDSDAYDDANHYTLGHYANAFLDLISALDLKNVHWVGSSMGGLIALSIAEQGRGDVFKSLTLVDVTHRPNLQACKFIADYVGERVPVMQSVEQLTVLTKMTLPLGNVSDEVWHHFAEHQLVKTDKGYEFHFDPKIARLAKPSLMEQIDHTEGLMAIDCPVALVAGAVSTLCADQEIADLLSLKPETRIHRVADAGHIPSLSDIDSQTFILNFLNAAV